MVTVFFVMNIGAVSAIVIALLVVFRQPQKNWLFELLRNEQAKSENLLLNILPKDIAAILKNESRTIADHYEGASVMFADMVGFTPLSAGLAPVDMVELLNEASPSSTRCWTNTGSKRFGRSAIATWWLSGVPRRRPDHAQALVRHGAGNARLPVPRTRFEAASTWSFRIGINSGAMIAGVIGRRKFVYDVWGDAVNVASRMESQGLGGDVQITQATYELIKDEFVCEPRGKVK